MSEGFRDIACLLGGYGVLCFLIAVFYVAPPRVPARKPAELDETMIDGAPTWVSASLLNRRPVKGILVFAHGYGCPGSRRVWARMAVAFDAEGYGVVVPALPGHDANPDRITGFGTKESRIVRACVQWAATRTEGPHPAIVAVGLSMGGAACWLAAGDEPLIDGVVTEGAFALFDEATDGWINATIPGFSRVLWPAKWFAQRLTGLDPKTIRPLDGAAVRHGLPALVLHGARDRIIHPSHGQRLATASGAELWVVEGAGHDTTQKIAYEEYRERIRGVVAMCAQEPAQSG